MIAIPEGWQEIRVRGDEVRPGDQLPFFGQWHAGTVTAVTEDTLWVGQIALVRDERMVTIRRPKPEGQTEAHLPVWPNYIDNR